MQQCRGAHLVRLFKEEDNPGRLSSFVYSVYLFAKTLVCWLTVNKIVHNDEVFAATVGNVILC